MLGGNAAGGWRPADRRAGGDEANWAPKPPRSIHAALVPELNRERRPIIAFAVLVGSMK